MAENQHSIPTPKGIYRDESGKINLIGNEKESLKNSGSKRSNGQLENHKNFKVRPQTATNRFKQN